MEAPIQPLSTSIMAIMCFGDVVFAVSGALTAAKYRMDVLGFVLIGTITGIGGGTLPLRGASSDPTVMKSL